MLLAMTSNFLHFKLVPMLFFAHQQFLDRRDDGTRESDGILVGKIDRPGKVLVGINGFTTAVFDQFYGFKAMGRSNASGRNGWYDVIPHSRY